LGTRTRIVDLYEKSDLKLFVLPLIRIRKTKNPITLISYIYHFSKTVLLLYKFIRKHKIELVHTNDLLDFPGNIAAYLAGVPSVQHIRLIVERPKWLNIALKRITLTFSSRVICVSKSVKELMYPGIIEKVTILYDWLDMETVEHTTGDSSLHDELGLDPNTPLVGCVGRLEKIKGQHLFIQAADIVADHVPDSHFVLVGGPTTNKASYSHYLMDLRERCKNGGNISFLGYRNDIANIMQQLAVMVQASIVPEAFGLVVMEAMASGAIVVAPDLGGAKEQVIGGVNGYLYEAGNYREMAEKIIAALKNLNDSVLRGNARQFAKTTFDKKSSVEKLMTIYDAITNLH
jgi:glycosyltransferase involved in cell wall biosynthesis